MRAVIFERPRALRVGTADDPRIEEAGDAIVRVERAGICGSDLHVYHGRETGLDPGTVMGHEFVGEVCETGAAVRGLAPGDRVVSPFTTSCGGCFYCVRGLSARCEAGQLFGWVEGGIGLQGAQAEYVRVPLADSTLAPLPEDVPADVALLLGDVLPTGHFCARMAGAGPDRVLAVVGCGPVGLTGVLACRELGAETVLAVDSVPERLELARAFGARPIDRSATDPLEVARACTAGRGVDAVLELVGSPAASRLAIDLVRPGGTVAAAGVHTEDRFAFSPVEAYDKNLTYRAGRCPARSLLDEVAPLARRRADELSRLISHRLRLDDGPRGYAIFDGKRDGCTKVVLSP